MRLTLICIAFYVYFQGRCVVKWLSHVYTISNSHLFAFHVHILRMPNCRLVPSHFPYLLRSLLRYLSLIQQLSHSFSHSFSLSQSVSLNHSNSHSVNHPFSTLKILNKQKVINYDSNILISIIHPFSKLAPYYTITMYPYNLEISKSTVPSGAVNLFNSQIANNPAISSPVPQPAQMTPGVSRSELLPGNQ